MTCSWYLDITGCGIGNIVLCISGFVCECRKRHVRPVVYCPNPDDLSRLRKDAFDLVGERPVDREEFDKSLVCNLQTTFDLEVVRVMQELVIPVKIKGMEAYAAGFSIRTTDPSKDTHEGDIVTFMNDVAIDAMKKEMARYEDKKVLVFSNTKDNLINLPANAVVYEYTNPDERNVSSHWTQWYLLSQCPVVYHGISCCDDDSVTSTFAPTAAVYGGIAKELVGVDNRGTLHRGQSYRW